MPKTSIHTVGIIGLGLLGGSLGLALKNYEVVERVIGYSRNPETIKTAKKREAIDEGARDIESIARESDVLILATPLNMIIETALQAAPYMKKGAILTDVGSTKQQIVEAVEPKMPDGVYFVGGHPMAGSDRSGIAAADTYLFEGAPYIFTETRKTDPKALKTLKSLVEPLDVRILTLSPELHDIAVAAVSHLPIAVASALVNTIDNATDGRDTMLDVASTGFRDTTRVAGGNTDMGRDIFLTNRKAVVAMLRLFRQSVERLEKLVEKGDTDGLKKELDKAQTLRRKIYSA